MKLEARLVGAETDGVVGAVARFADGSAVEADLVVGADGIHSAVRESLFGKQAPRFTGTVCWRGLVPYDALPSNRVTKDWNLYMGPQRHLIHYMVRRGDVVNFVAHVETDSWTGDLDPRMRPCRGTGDLRRVARAAARHDCSCRHLL